ncbi:MAG: dockerin type I domain-containing protein [Planctomycetota bacterium]|jgi:hypothetical protein
MRTFTKFTKILAVVAAVGLCAGGALAAAFNFADTTPRQILIDSEGLQDQSCRNMYNNPPGLPPAPIGGCVFSTGAGCPNHPNLRTADPSCTVYATSATTANGPFFFPDPVGVPNNDSWANAIHLTGTTWRIKYDEEVWGAVTQRTLGQSNAKVLAASPPNDYTLNTGISGPGSVLPTVLAGPSGAPEYYRGSAVFNGTTTLGLFGIPAFFDAPYFGQGQDPTKFTFADPGIPLQFSCNHGATLVTPTAIAAPFTQDVAAGGTTTLTDVGALALPTSPAGGGFAAYCAAVGLPACSFGTDARFVLGGPSVGAIVDIIGQTNTTLTLADPVTVTVGDSFIIETYASVGGAPFPQGPIYGGICPNASGSTVGLPAEPGYDTSPPAGVEQMVAFTSAFTTLGTNPLTNPVWAPFDNRMEEVVDGDSDGIPDRFDNCVSIANGPLAGPPTCYRTVDKDGVTTAVPALIVGFDQVDTDGDGNGNPCDGDLNNDTAVNSTDQVALNTDLKTGSSTPGSGSDMNCDTAVNSTDQTLLNAQLKIGAPGPSGLWCAGTGTPNAPCVF